MKQLKSTIAAIILMSGIHLAAQDTGDITLEFSNPNAPATVKIDLRRGGIIVKGTSRKDVFVKYTSQASKKPTKTKDGLTRISGKTLDLEASEYNNVVKIDSDSWNKGVDLEVEVPMNVDLNVETYNGGDILVENIKGEVVAENYNGRITLNSVSGSAVADTYNGRIIVTFDEVTPNIPMAFNTYNGKIDITLPSTVKASLKMKSNQGDIYTDFEMDLKKSGPIRKEDSKSGVKKVSIDEWIRGDINGGGPEFTLKNYNGDIYVRKK